MNNWHAIGWLLIGVISMSAFVVDSQLLGQSDEAPKKIPRKHVYPSSGGSGQNVRMEYVAGREADDFLKTLPSEKDLGNMRVIESEISPEGGAAIAKSTVDTLWLDDCRLTRDSLSNLCSPKLHILRPKRIDLPDEGFLGLKNAT